MDTAGPADATARTRLLAVLAADAVGFSRLMSLDDNGTVVALDAARAVFTLHIAAHEGRVIDMAGDSVLSVFETATAAVKAALAIQHQLSSMPRNDVPEDRRMRFRIGVHLGDVIEKADGSVYGDGVNIAARLQSLADPGSVAVSEPVRVTVKGRLPASFEDLGERQAKNIADPVRAFRVTPAAAPPTAGRAPPAADLDMLPGIAVLPFTCRQRRC